MGGIGGVVSHVCEPEPELVERMTRTRGRASFSARAISEGWDTHSHFSKTSSCANRVSHTYDNMVLGMRGMRGISNPGPTREIYVLVRQVVSS